MIHRDNNRTAQSASKENRNPLGAVLAPQHHAVTLPDFPRIQFPAKPQRHLHDLTIGEPLHAIAAALPVGPLVAVRLKVRQEKLC
jgi:hypothetical protein